ncbi:MAG: Arc family DNA binding domain-containing protein [Bacteroidota bacterium]
MADKKPFVLRMDADVFASLEKWAADEFRSANGQIEYLLTKVLRESGRLKKSRNNGRK